MRKLVVGVLAALIAGPAVFMGTASAAGPVFHCWAKDQGPGSEDPSSVNFVVVPSEQYPNKSDAKKDGYIRCFAQGPQGG